MPDDIFTTFQHSASNKMFRKEFVRSHGIKFQEIRRADDVLFTNTSLILAGRICYVGKSFLTYRKSEGEPPRDRLAPYDYYKAITGLRDEIMRAGIFEEVKKSYISAVAEIITKQLYNQENSTIHADMYRFVKEKAVPEFGLDRIEATDVNPAKLYREAYREITFILNMPYEEYLSHRMGIYKNRNTTNLGKLRKARNDSKTEENEFRLKEAGYLKKIKRKDEALSEAKRRINSIIHSRTYRFAQIMSKWLRVFKGNR
jgi:hypothetical protein